jgi:hypothetical protein
MPKEQYPHFNIRSLLEIFSAKAVGNPKQRATKTEQPKRGQRNQHNGATARNDQWRLPRFSSLRPIKGPGATQKGVPLRP